MKGKVIMSEQRKQMYKKIKEYVEAQGYKLKSTEYVRSRDKLEMECPVGHDISMTWSNFQSGKRCGVCSGRYRNTTKTVSVALKKHGYKLLSTYKRAKDKLDMECPKGHFLQMSWECFKSGNRCPECQGKKRYTTADIATKLEAEGCILLSQYKNSETKFIYICKCGRLAYINLNNFGQGKRCRGCAIDKQKARAQEDRRRILAEWDELYG